MNLGPDLLPLHTHPQGGVTYIAPPTDTEVADLASVLQIAPSTDFRNAVWLAYHRLIEGTIREAKRPLSLKFYKRFAKRPDKVAAAVRRANRKPLKTQQDAANAAGLAALNWVAQTPSGTPRDRAEWAAWFSAKKPGRPSDSGLRGFMYQLRDIAERFGSPAQVAQPEELEGDDYIPDESQRGLVLVAMRILAQAASRGKVVAVVQLESRHASHALLKFSKYANASARTCRDHFYAPRGRKVRI